MLRLLKSWSGTVDVDDRHYDSIKAVLSASETLKSRVHIKLHARAKSASETLKTASEGKLETATRYRINVKQYMTKRATASFDFMAKWNNDNPMPYRTMIGTIEKETRGMVYMNLHADIYAERITTCMKCGRVLTNPVSQYFGIGPECGGHNYVHPFSSDAELKAAVEEYRKTLQQVQWSGWIIKSAILEKEEMV